MKLGIGIDTGGTYTDAVIFDFDKREVLAKGKSLTTKENLEAGIVNALDSLPEELLASAEILSLSTTLATNACVENKGGRAKLILVGTTRKVLEWIDAKTKYGLKNEDVFCVDTESVYDSSITDVPDWYKLIEAEDEWLSDAQALAIAEVPAMRNGAMCERYAKEKLSEKYHVPFVMANELALDLNVMERGATALLNARLLPVIEEFMTAVTGALKKRNIDISKMIVRSDGSLMSDGFAESYPVQTILSGPASSVIGARNLSDSENCLIIDMGGTTTDISIVRDGIPQMSQRIRIGGYRTQIQGVYIDTFGLGGDSQIVIKSGKLALNERRVQPLCITAEVYPEIIPQLEKLVKSERTHSVPLHEVFYLIKEPKDMSQYSSYEKAIIEKLRKHPIMLGSGEMDIYNLKTDRLESEGIIMRSGLTPTDIMHIRGDFSKYDKSASVLGAKYMMLNLPGFEDGDVSRFCEAVYDLACKKMYVNIMKILLENAYPEVFAKGITDQLEELIELSWNGKNNEGFLSYSFSTNVKLIGIGAPTHIFLPKVAEVMGVDYVIPPDAEVANAVGAITADVSASCRIRISPNNSDFGVDGYNVYCRDSDEHFEEMDEAVKFAEKAAVDAAVKDARSRGALGELVTDVKVDSKVAHAKTGAAVELDTFVTATAKGRVC